MEFSNMQNTKKKNQALVSSAFVMGILSVISAVTCFSFLSPIFGGLGIIFALLSKGKEETFEKKAKYGLVMSIITVVAVSAIMAGTFIFSYVTLSQYEPDELHDYLNETYEEAYGKSFDDMYEEIYGEDFNEVYENMYNDLYGEQ